jgi:lipopolysaccharide biosynthesis protein
MIRILVVQHIYYHNQVDYFISKLANITSCEWDLIVTYSSYSKETEDKFRKFKSNVRFIEVKNVGYDVWPFIHVMKMLDLSPYNYVMKLHTKNFQTDRWKINGLNLKGFQWRDILVDSLLKSQKQFTKVLKEFEKDPETGMICSREMLVKPGNKHPEDTHLLDMEAKRIGIVKIFEPFCAGTMFIVRRECLKKIIDADLNEHVWGKESKTRSGGSTAHVYERLFGSAVADSGYKLKSLQAYCQTGTFVRMQSVISPILKKLCTIDYDRNGGKVLFLFGFKIHRFK